MLAILAYVLGAITLFISFCLWVSRKELAEKKGDYYARTIAFFLIGIISISVGIYFSVNPVNKNDFSYDDTPTYNSQTKTKYKKCALCGDRVPEDDMRGKWCKDCQNDAFGEDGWYYDIQD